MREPGPDQFNGDHSIAKSRGGNGDESNLNDTCRWCNQVEKRDLLPEEWMMYKLLQRLAGIEVSLPVVVYGAGLKPPKELQFVSPRAKPDDL